MSTLHETAIINQERQRAAESMTEQLKKLGVDVRIAHYTGDSSFPTEYTISYQNIRATGPTFDMALIDWLKELIEVCREPATSYRAMETSLQALAGGISNLRTELLVVKAMVAKEDEP